MLKKKNSSDKSILRAELKKERNELEPEYVKYASECICHKIVSSALYDNAKVILGYLAFGKEVNCDDVIKRALSDGKIVCVPFIVDNEHFLVAKLDSLEHLSFDRYGIRTVCEPIHEVSKGAIDLVLVPGLAFGKDGSRIGMGAGYYDRFLTESKAATIGLAYKKLMRESIPVDEHDVFVKNLVHEEDLWSLKNM